MVVRPSSGESCAAPQVVADFDQLINEPFQYIEEYIKKKVRNLEKRKVKLDGYNLKLKNGEKLTKDQHQAAKSSGEVNGMILFASELISHMTSVDHSCKKERKKRTRKDEQKTESDRVESVTRALEIFTLMHLSDPENKIVTPLRERTSFHPSPGAHLNNFASGTAKLLIDLSDENAEIFVDEEVGNVKSTEIKEMLEEIRPKYNPVPEESEDEYLEEEVEIDEKQVESEAETKPDEPALEIEAEPETEIHHEIEEDIIYQPEGAAEEPEFIADEPAVVPDEIDLQESLEFVNKEVYGEEDHIKDILVEVSSGFNFLAPAHNDTESEDETENVSFGNQGNNGRAEPINYEDRNYQNEQSWQQNANQPNYRNGNGDHRYQKNYDTNRQPTH